MAARVALPDADMPTAADSRIPSNNARIAQGVLSSSFSLLPEAGVMPDGSIGRCTALVRGDLDTQAGRHGSRAWKAGSGRLSERYKGPEDCGQLVMDSWRCEKRWQTAFSWGTMTGDLPSPMLS